jgi:Leucine-rich repeat (LRR) protein
LDLSSNRLSNISTRQLRGCPHLRDLVLSGNPLTSIFDLADIQSAGLFGSLRRLDLSHVPMQAFSVMALRLFPSLHSLNLSHCGLDVLHDLQPWAVALSSLMELNLAGCPLTYFLSDLFQRLEALRDVRADNY